MSDKFNEMYQSGNFRASGKACLSVCQNRKKRFILHNIKFRHL
jgi:hypothetical protein